MNARGKREATLDTTSFAGVAGLARSRAFLLAEGGLAAGERLRSGLSSSAPNGEGSPELPRTLPWALPRAIPRALLIGTVASDLYLGYAALRKKHERSPAQPGPDASLDWDREHRRGAGRVRDAAGSLGGALIKAGQFASTRPDLLPAAYIQTLSSLQDRVPPLPWPVVERTLARELGRGLKEVFAAVEPRPLASASLAQVHRARLRDGRAVALKIRYPHVAGLVEADLGALRTVFGAISALEPKIQLSPIADYLEWTLPLELDFLREAEALRELKAALKDRDDVLIPDVIGEFSTERLLVMELMEGYKITDREALVSAGIEPRAVAELLNDVYADQIYNHHYLHADPHPGNLLVQPGKNGPKLVLLDHGLTLPLEPELVGPLEKVVRALPEGDLETTTAALKEAGLDVGNEDDLGALLQLVGVLFDSGDAAEADASDANAMDLGSFGENLGSGIGDIPPKLLLVGRAIGLLDGITRQLDPDLDALEIVGRYTNP
ncbi:MAG: AarF/UbiB family protein [Rubrobacteraceae bacterium]